MLIFFIKIHAFFPEKIKNVTTRPVWQCQRKQGKKSPRPKTKVNGVYSGPRAILHNNVVSVHNSKTVMMCVHGGRAEMWVVNLPLSS